MEKNPFSPVINFGGANPKPMEQICLAYPKFYLNSISWLKSLQIFPLWESVRDALVYPLPPCFASQEPDISLVLLDISSPKPLENNQDEGTLAD